MSDQSPKNLEEAIRQSGEGWLIDWYAPPSDAINVYRQTLREIDEHAKKKLGKNAPDLSESAILKEYDKNPQRVRGFFQAFWGHRTPDMLLMAWRIIQGMQIKQVDLSYLRQESFRMQVVLESPYGEDEEIYNSINIDDFKIFRHVLIMNSGGSPVFDGFYPLRVSK